MLDTLIVVGTSMLFSLSPGDSVEVSPVNSVAQLDYGDLLVFQFGWQVENGEPALIKRVVGLPGDSLFVTGEDTLEVTFIDSSETVYVDTTLLRRGKMAITIHQVGSGPNQRTTVSEVVGQNSVEQLFVPGYVTWDVVPAGMVYVKCDNPYFQYDSRRFGLVDQSYFIGKATKIGD